MGNGKILREGPFDNIWIQPAAGDVGGALGAALFVWHQLLENPRKAVPGDAQKGSLLGPRYDDGSIQTFLDSADATYRQFADEEELVEEIAQLIAQEKVVGHMAGPMEFGPRALGNRSILGDSRSPAMQSVMNLKIKFRESFRPFAPSVILENAPEYFDMTERVESPYMLLAVPVKDDKRTQTSPGDATGLEKLKQLRSVIPAVTHVDYSARVQTVDEKRHGRYYRILKRFRDKTGCPVVINTSFNVRGEPIVCSPEDAYRCFMATNMDALVIENFLLLKQEQPKAKEHEVDTYLAKFQLD